MGSYGEFLFWKKHPVPVARSKLRSFSLLELIRAMIEVEKFMCSKVDLWNGNAEVYLLKLANLETKRIPEWKYKEWQAKPGMFIGTLSYHLDKECVIDYLCDPFSPPWIETNFGREIANIIHRTLYKEESERRKRDREERRLAVEYKPGRKRFKKAAEEFNWLASVQKQSPVVLVCLCVSVSASKPHVRTRTYFWSAKRQNAFHVSRSAFKPTCARMQAILRKHATLVLRNEKLVTAWLWGGFITSPFHMLYWMCKIPAINLKDDYCYRSFTRGGKIIAWTLNSMVGSLFGVTTTVLWPISTTLTVINIDERVRGGKGFFYEGYRKKSLNRKLYRVWRAAFIDE